MVRWRAPDVDTGPIRFRYVPCSMHITIHDLHGADNFRYSFVQTQLVFWQDLNTMEIISRRKLFLIRVKQLHLDGRLLTGCTAVTAGQYYDIISGNCVFSCPHGFQGVYATGTCDPGELERLQPDLIIYSILHQHLNSSSKKLHGCIPSRCVCC